MLNSRLSECAYIHGNFNFNVTPMAPTVTKTPVHRHPGKRGPWEIHGEPGWHVGPSLDHYRCIQNCIPRTRSIMNRGTV